MERTDRHGPAEGLPTSPAPAAHPGPILASPAATEEEQAVYGRDGGAGVLACDEVAIQHDMHGIRLTGCRRPEGRKA